MVSFFKKEAELRIYSTTEDAIVTNCQRTDSVWSTANSSSIIFLLHQQCKRKKSGARFVILKKT
jgi:hypothetical protein